MTVQAGIWNLNGEPVSVELLSRISHATAQYGPDGELLHFDGATGLVYRPFHTTLESRNERQPYISAAGAVITWDGRLDNRDDLILQFRNDRLEDQTDVALVAAAYDLWGTDCFAKLVGDWAVAIWAPQEQELILGRDYMGVRQLFYYPKPNKIIWCSHLAPLALCGDRFTLSDEYIAGYLGFWPAAHLTPYSEIHSVPPGSFVRIHKGNVYVRPYRAFNPRHKIRYKTDSEYEEQFLHLFRQAVRRRLRSDSPVLAELSGGLDSSSIVCMADDILVYENPSRTSVDTFSFYEPDEPDEDDFAYLTKVEEKRGRCGHHAEVRGATESFCLDYSHFIPIPGFGVRQEVKNALSDVIKRGKYRVILAGNGGDEFLGQAFDPRVQMADLLVQIRLKDLAKHLVKWSLLFRRPLLQLLVETAIFLLPTPLRAQATTITQIDPWIDPKFSRSKKLSSRRLEAAEGKWWWLPSVRDSFQTQAILARKMTNTMPSPVEKRYPYLDQNLIEFLTAIPTSQLIRPGERRSLMRRALVGLLPAEILSRRTKAGSGRSVVRTILRHWTLLEDVIASPLISHLGYVNRFHFQSALERLKNGQVPRSILHLLKGLSLELWLREAIARDIVSISHPPMRTTPRHLGRPKGELSAETGIVVRRE